MDLKKPFARSLNQNLLREYPVLLSYLEKLGDTPLLQVPGPANGARIFAKAEWANPNGTVKDRVSFGMLYRLLEKTLPADRHKLHILEYSGGSLAVSLACLCRDLEIPLTIVMPSSTDAGVVTALRERGAEIIFSPAEKAFWGVIETTRAIAHEHPEWSFLYQHENDANLWIHRETTGREIIEQLPHDLTDGPLAWIASVGTGGTMIGVFQALSMDYPKTRLFMSSPSELPYGTALPPNAAPRFLGSGGFGCGRKQPFVTPRENQIAGNVLVEYSEALDGVREFFRLTGHQIGSSAAANWIAAQTVASSLGPNSTVITIFPSGTPGFERQKIGWTESVSVP